MKKILIVIVLLILLILGSGAYFGFFSEINFEKQSIGPYEVVYKIHTGDYSKVGATFTEIELLLFKNGVKFEESFGVYFSDPKTVIKENMVSAIGFIVPGMTQENFDSLKLLDNDLKKTVLKPVESFVAKFSYKNSFSLIFAPMIVYPKIDSYMIQNNIKPVPIMEIYDIKKGEKINFVIVQDENYYNSLVY